MQGSLDKGVFTLSLDTEMAWGFNHLPPSLHPEHQFQDVRRIVERLLKLMEQYEIQTTWAVVGHLFLEQCREEEGCKHPEIVPPRYSWLARDWLEPDPCSDVEQAPFRYGPDIIDMIMNCPVPQEVGCHNFSHAIVGDPGCPRESFESELQACRNLAAHKQIELKSFVYPKNSVGHVDVLPEHGFTSYRGRQPCWFEGYPWHLWRIAHKVDAFFPVPPPVVYPSYSNGIWNIPASAYYVDRDKRWSKCLPIWMRVWKAKQGLRRAAQRRGIYHLWFHPYNMAGDMEGLFHGLEQIFIAVDKLRYQGVLENLTMGQLAERLSAGLEMPVTSSETR
jgi:peptidoglycan/xylan/chitin deacetylase (PgdA/CDA1 family)